MKRLFVSLAVSLVATFGVVGVSLVTSPAPSWAEGKNPKEERPKEERPKQKSSMKELSAWSKSNWEDVKSWLEKDATTCEGTLWGVYDDSIPPSEVITLVEGNSSLSVGTGFSFDNVDKNNIPQWWGKRISISNLKAKSSFKEVVGIDCTDGIKREVEEWRGEPKASPPPEPVGGWPLPQTDEEFIRLMEECDEYSVRTFRSNRIEYPIEGQCSTLGGNWYMYNPKLICKEWWVQFYEGVRKEAPVPLCKQWNPKPEE